MSNFRFTRSDSLPIVIKYLIIINVVVFVAQLLLDQQIGLTYLFALWNIGPQFRPHQLVTHMFTHDPRGFFHILFNMLNLYMFGKMLENIWGPKRFLNFYLMCGLGAAALHLLIQYLTNTTGLAIGASGAVMGVMVAFAYLFPNTPLYMMFFPFPIKAKWLILGLVAIDLFGGLGVYSSGIAHFAHLGGALTGFIIVLIWNKTNKRRFY